MQLWPLPTRVLEVRTTARRFLQTSPRVFWRPLAEGSYPKADLALVSLVTTTAPSVKLPFTATKIANMSYYAEYLVVPDQPLVAGVTYVFADDNTCSSYPPTPDVVFQVGPAAPLPSTLGTLSASASDISRFEVWTHSGVCYAEAESASSRIELQFSDDAAPWRDVLRFETFVDGVPWWDARPSVPGGGLDLIFRVCYSEDGGVEGVEGVVHEVTMRATLPGTDLVLTTPPVTIQLECPPERIPPTPDSPEVLDVAGCSTTSASTMPWWLIALTLGLARRSRSKARSLAGPR